MANRGVLLSTESKQPRFFYGYIVVGAAFLIMVIVWGTFYSFGVFFKPMLAEFGWTRAMTSGAYSLSFLLSGLLGIVAGRLNDRFGPRLVMTVCGFLFGLGYLLMSQISAAWQLYLFYGVIIAIGLSAAFVPLVSTVARWFVKRRGLMSGITVSGIGIGTIIMPPIARWLISIYGWRTSYIIIGIVVLVLIMAAAQFLRRDPGKIGQLPDGESGVQEEEPASEAMEFSLRGAIHTRQLWMLCVIFVCIGFCFQAILVHIVPHATDIGISVVSAASILSIIGGLSIVGRIGMGSTGDRIGNKPALIVCLIVMLVAFVWLLVVAKELWMLSLFAVIFGFAYGGLVALESPILAKLFGLRAHGAILGIVAFSVTLGGAIGPLLAGRIYDITDSYNLAFLVCAVLSVIALMLASLLKPTRGKGGTNDAGRGA